MEGGGGWGGRGRGQRKRHAGTGTAASRLSVHTRKLSARNRASAEAGGTLNMWMVNGASTNMRHADGRSAQGEEGVEEGRGGKKESGTLWWPISVVSESRFVS